MQNPALAGIFMPASVPAAKKFNILSMLSILLTLLKAGFTYNQIPRTKLKASIKIAVFTAFCTALPKR